MNVNIHIIFQGKGEMKTYWLHGRLKPAQTTFPNTPILQEPPPSIDPVRAEEFFDSTDTRSLYSPVTFEDVSRYSPIMSPTSSTISDVVAGVDHLKLEDPLKPSFDFPGRSKGNVSDVKCFVL